MFFVRFPMGILARASLLPSLMGEVKTVRRAARGQLDQQPSRVRRNQWDAIILPIEKLIT